MKEYQKPEVEFIALNASEAITDDTSTPGMSGGWSSFDPFAPVE